MLSPRDLDGHKGRYGHVLVIGGDHGFAGRRSVGRAAARCGAGKVSLITRPEHVPVMIARQPEVMARGVDQPAEAASLIEAYR